MRRTDDVHHPTDLEQEFVQLGRNLADRCWATFLTTLAEMTTDPVLVAAALRGRREARDVGVRYPNADIDAAVQVVVATERTTIARVRDDDGIFEVTRTSATGRWSCTCSDGYGCVHVRAVVQTTEAT